MKTNRGFNWVFKYNNIRYDTKISVAIIEGELLVTFTFIDGDTWVMIYRDAEGNYDTDCNFTALFGEHQLALDAFYGFIEHHEFYEKANELIRKYQKREEDVRIEMRLRELEDLVRLSMRGCYVDEIEANPSDTSAIIIDRMRDDGVIVRVANIAIPLTASKIVELAAENMDLFIYREPVSGPAFSGEPTPINTIVANIADYFIDIASKELLAIEKEVKS